MPASAIARMRDQSITRRRLRSSITTGQSANAANAARPKTISIDETEEKIENLRNNPATPNSNTAMCSCTSGNERDRAGGGAIAKEQITSAMRSFGGCHRWELALSPFTRFEKPRVR